MANKKDPFEEREAQKYKDPVPSREFILAHLDERGSPATQFQLEDELGLQTAERKEAFRRRLIAMTRDGQLLRNRKGAYAPLGNLELISGRVIGHKDGFGFVVPDTGGEDLFITPRQMRVVFHGDRVLARVASIDSRGRREGVIVEVLEHNTKQLVGRLCAESGAAYVEPSNQRIAQDILIPKEALHGATHGQMVVVALTAQPTSHGLPIGEIIEVLGDHMAPGMEINVAIRNHELPHVWPEAASAEAARFAPTVTEEAYAGRTDFRKLPFVTIDGDDAKDFDDAIYCEPQSQGGFVLYVAIADVSHYVLPGMALDKEAYERGNSVYFPNRVIPMLPEALSNNLCSLKPKVDRLVMVCKMTIDEDGEIVSSNFYNGVIHSHERLTYQQVHAMMEKRDARMKKRFESVVPHLEDLYALFHILQASRARRGAIDFDMPETKIVYGSDRKIEKIMPYERFDSHRVVEECMLCANISTANFLKRKKQPTLYRVHEGPNEDKLHDLQRFLGEIGHKIPASRKPTPADYSRILQATKERPDANLIQTMLLRSMSQAIYSPDNRGHFGLAYDAYTHFTSPIRRYPDLLVHRAIKSVLAQEKAALDSNYLVKMGEHCSMTERRADDATSEVTDWLKCEFMLDKVGKMFPGKLSGITSFGIFVELTDIYVEGLVHISALPGDYYQFDPVKHVLRGERTGRCYQLGDAITVLVARVDLDQGQIDFVLEDSGENNKPARPKKKKSRHTKSSGKKGASSSQKPRKRK